MAQDDLNTRAGMTGRVAGPALDAGYRKIGGDNNRTPIENHRDGPGPLTASP
jgi:hypothetical protein